MNSPVVHRSSGAVPRLLVLRLSAFGDVIHTIPAVVALRERFEIEWAVEKPYAELVEIVARVRAIPLSLRQRSLKNLRAVRGHDVAVDFQGLLKSALLARISGANARYGFAPQFVRERAASWFVNHRVAIDPSRHVVEWNLQLAQAVDSEARMPEVDFRPFAAPGPSAFEGRIVLIPGAGRAEKEWPADRFRRLAGALGAEALAVWGPGERALAEATGAEVAPATSLRELARLLRDARLVIGGDTGPLHLAAALGTPVVGLYGPTSPFRNGPYGQIGRCVETFTTTRAMRDINVDAVMRKVDEVLR
ncbi:MAG TPA: glycosyltransferase family 9 protein [Thermoanaerobaculia bacterium]|nr:glycosyltransferase family 9 protein [Thermoanaerobaculia bacterium]